MIEKRTLDEIKVNIKPIEWEDMYREYGIDMGRGEFKPYQVNAQEIIDKLTRCYSVINETENGLVDDDLYDTHWKQDIEEERKRLTEDIITFESNRFESPKREEPVVLDHFINKTPYDSFKAVSLQLARERGNIFLVDYLESGKPLPKYENWEWMAYDLEKKDPMDHETLRKIAQYMEKHFWFLENSGFSIHNQHWQLGMIINAAKEIGDSCNEPYDTVASLKRIRWFIDLRLSDVMEYVESTSDLIGSEIGKGTFLAWSPEKIQDSVSPLKDFYDYASEEQKKDIVETLTRWEEIEQEYKDFLFKSKKVND